MNTGTWVLVAALVLATAFGLLRAVRDGRFAGTHEVRGAKGPNTVVPGVLDGTDIEHTLGERATLLQFSSAFCAPCRVTRRILSEVADVVPGVTHVEIDAEHHLDLVRRVGITRTPTTLILDAAGRELSRATGTPNKSEVIATLDRVIGQQNTGPST